VDCWVEQRIIKLVFTASLLSTQHYGVRAKTGWIGIKARMTYLPVDCFCEPAL
jgi:hypothetical protein